MSLLSNIFSFMPTCRPPSRWAHRVYIRLESCTSTGVGNAHPSMQRCILICTASPRLTLRRAVLGAPSALPRQSASDLSRGQEDYFMNMHRAATLIHIHGRVIHNGPLPLPTSDASALISSLLSPFRPGVPPQGDGGGRESAF